MCSKFNWLCLLLCFALNTSLSHAVVLSTEDGATNTEPPADDPGFNNVGILDGFLSRGSGIYLGNRWVLTAAHVGAGTITLNGQEYENIVDQTVRLQNPEGTGLSQATDLILMRLQEEPDLPSLRLGCRSVSINTDVTLIGGGRDRDANLSRWFREDVPGDNNDIWTLVDSEEDDFNESGYLTQSSRTVRWGESRVSGTNFDIGTSQGDVSSFQTDFFSPESVIESSAQAVTGDSGGGVFQKNGVWELVGMIHAVGLKENQPRSADAAVFGGSTFIAELFDYAEQIREIADFEPAPGDFNGDGEITANELDELLAAINSRDQFSSCHYDLTGNGSVTFTDFDQLLVEAETLTGDANLDGTVGFEDFLLLARSYESEDAGWGHGDFDGDGSVNFGDFLLLSNNFGESFGSAVGGSVAAFAVPEPSSHCSALLLLFFAFAYQRNRSAASHQK